MSGEADPVERLKVFVSYSRNDVEFADQLTVALEDRGFEPILDRHAIDGAENWRDRLSKLILSSDAVVFVLTEHSASSPVCAWEVDEAQRLAKRIIPVTPREAALNPPKVLADLNWIYFYPKSSIPGSGAFDGMRKLDRALRVDVAWLREQTRLSERAAEWALEPTEDRLLRGHALREAEEWVGRTPKDAAVSAQLREYLTASTNAEQDRERLAKTQLAEREAALRQAEAAVKEVAAAQSARARTSARFRFFAAISLVLGVVLSAGAGFGLWLAAENGAKAAERGERAAAAETSAAMASTAAELEAANAGAARARAKELFASNVADLAEQLSLSGYGPQAVMMALAGDPAARGEDVQRKHNPEGYIKLRNTLALAYAQNRLKHSFKAATPKDYDNDGVRDLAISPDSRTLVATADNVARVWTLGGKLLATLKGHTAPIRTVAFSPTGETILTGSADGTARLWSLTGKPVHTFEVGAGEVTGVAFGEFGDYIATASSNGSAKVWKPDGTLEATMSDSDEAGGAFAVTFVANSDDVLVGYANSRAIRWSVKGDKIETYMASQASAYQYSGVVSVAYAGSDYDVAFAGSDGGINLPYVGGSNTDRPDPEPEESKPVAPPVATPSAETPLTDDAATNPAADPAASTPKKPPKTPEVRGSRLSGGFGTAWDVAFSKDGKHLLAGFDDGSAWLWNRDGELQRVIHGHHDAVQCVAFTPDGKHIVTGSADGTIRVEDLESPVERSLGDRFVSLGSFALSPAGSVLFVPRYQPPELWTLSGKKIRSIGEKSFLSAAFAEDGKSMFFADYASLERWSTGGTKLATIATDPERDIQTMRVSPKGNSIVTGFQDGSIAIYSAGGKKLLWIPGAKGAGAILGVAFSAQGDKIAASDEDGWARVWTTGGAALASVPAPQNYFANDITFSPEGDSVLVAYGNDVARLWSFDNKLLAVFSGHRAQVRSVAFSPDGKWVATGSNDLTARLWSRDGQLLDIFWGHTNGVSRVGFSPDGRTLLTTSTSGPARVWPISPILFLPAAQQVALACKQLEGIGITKFSDEESRRYRILEGANLDPCAAPGAASLTSSGGAPQ